jgi:DNA-binding MarR family transcriptional regulator
MRTLAERRGTEIALVDEALRFMRVIWHLQHALQSKSKRMERTLGVTGPQRLAMRVVGTLPDITSSELANVLHLDPSTISGILQRLVAKRLVARTSDPVDRRRMRLRLTTKGERLNQPSTAGTVESSVHGTLGTFSRSKVRSAVDVLEHLAGSLGTGAV